MVDLFCKVRRTASGRLSVFDVIATMKGSTLGMNSSTVKSNLSRIRRTYQLDSRLTMEKIPNNRTRTWVCDADTANAIAHACTGSSAQELRMKVPLPIAPLVMCQIRRTEGGLYALRMARDPRVVKFGCSIQLDKRIASYKVMSAPSEVLMRLVMPDATRESIYKAETVLLKRVEDLRVARPEIIRRLDGGSEWYETDDIGTIRNLLDTFVTDLKKIKPQNEGRLTYLISNSKATQNERTHSNQPTMSTKMQSTNSSMSAFDIERIESIRRDKDGNFRVFDLIGVAKGIKKRNSSTIRKDWARIKREYPRIGNDIHISKVPGCRKRCDVCDMKTAIQIIMVCTGRKAAEFRSACATKLVQYFNGDPALIAEIQANYDRNNGTTSTITMTTVPVGAPPIPVAPIASSTHGTSNTQLASPSTERNTDPGGDVVCYEARKREIVATGEMLELWASNNIAESRCLDQKESNQKRRRALWDQDVEFRKKQLDDTAALCRQKFAHQKWRIEEESNIRSSMAKSKNLLSVKDYLNNNRGELATRYGSNLVYDNTSLCKIGKHVATSYRARYDGMNPITTTEYLNNRRIETHIYPERDHDLLREAVGVWLATKSQPPSKRPRHSAPSGGASRLQWRSR